MGGYPWITWTMAVLLLTAGGCERDGASAPNAASPRVASLVPAATDLLIAMGAADHLVAVSNYDVPRQETRGLPRVGDYQSFDWEQIAAARPQVMIVFMTPQRMPPGLTQRADRLGIRLVNVRTERLEDILAETANLGRIVNEPAKAQRLAQSIREQVDRAGQLAMGKPKLKTLLVRDKEAAGVVGRGNFLNDVLEAAGGRNVIETDGWPVIDREMLLSLQPQVIVQLLPEASPQAVQQARRVWQGMPQIPAVQAGRVHVLTDWWVQNSGAHVGQLAVRLAELLHGATKDRATAGSGS